MCCIQYQIVFLVIVTSYGVSYSCVRTAIYDSAIFSLLSSDITEYCLTNDTLTWADAAVTCNQLGYRLAVVDTSDIVTFLYMTPWLTLVHKICKLYKKCMCRLKQLKLIFTSLVVVCCNRAVPPGPGFYWLGLNCTGNSYTTWLDGTPVTFTNWEYAPSPLYCLLNFTVSGDTSNQAWIPSDPTSNYTALCQQGNVYATITFKACIILRINIGYLLHEVVRVLIV